MVETIPLITVYEASVDSNVRSEMFRQQVRFLDDQQHTRERNRRTPGVQRVVPEPPAFVLDHHAAAERPEDVEAHHVQPEEAHQNPKVEHIAHQLTRNEVPTHVQVQNHQISAGQGKHIANQRFAVDVSQLRQARIDEQGCQQEGDGNDDS